MDDIFRSYTTENGTRQAYPSTCWAVLREFLHTPRFQLSERGVGGMLLTGFLEC